jgi:hypothetical protein
MDEYNELQKKTFIECVSLINLRLRKQEHYIATESDGKRALAVNYQIKHLLAIFLTEINDDEWGKE